MGRLLELRGGDEPAAWARLGFAVADGGVVRVGGVAVRLTGEGGGLTGWTLEGDGPLEVEGVPTTWVAAPAEIAGDAVEHPNGASAIDHVVLLTDSRDRSAAALVAAGGDERGRAEPPGVPVAMAFVRFGEAIVEVAEGRGVGWIPHLWGLVAVVSDLGALARDLGPSLVGEVRPAVQPGRSIATVQEAAGLGTELAFMSPRVRARS